MKKYILILILLFLTNCTNDEIIYYQYKGVTATRVDRGNQIYFYYGYFDGKVKPFPNSFIKAEYHGFNSGMWGFLIFNDENKIIIDGGMGAFEKNGGDLLLILEETNNNFLITKLLDSIKGNFQNVIEVSDLIDLEKKRNLYDNHTKVKAIYP